MQFTDAKALFSRNQIELTEEQYEKLAKYAALLTEESERQNVTAVRDINEIWIRHFLDSAYLLRYLRDNVKIIDIGTGGGIPAIPLAILNPTLDITMLDSELRKIEFCQNAVEKLGLNAKAICGRAEELAKQPEYREQFDIAVSRAMANGSMLTELSVPFIKTGGSLIAMKGRQYDPETERFESASEALGCSIESVQKYELEGEQKHLITVRKKTETPQQYPRRFAKIKRDPL
jgi:16S rRNA (guanine527-N7)-methyltransferase